jgi:PAS domain S-box-containing protein
VPNPTSALSAVPIGEAERSRQLAAANAALQAEIAERRRVEAALRASEARYRAVVESQNELICRYLPDTTLTFVNEAYCRHFGYTREELIGRRFLELIPEPGRAAAQAHVASLIERPRVVADEHQVLLPDGSLGWQQWIDHVILDADDRPVELQGIGRDITERKQAEERVLTMQALLQSTVDALSAHVAILDESGTILVVNYPWRRSARSHGPRGSRHAVGTNYLSACEAAGARGDDAAARTASGRRAILAGTQTRFGLVYADTVKRQPAWFQVHITRFSRDGTRCLVVAHADVTELKQTEHQLYELAGRLLRSQDDERRRIAREMHDGAAQKLFAMTMSLARLQESVAGRPDLLEIIAESCSLGEGALEDIRTLSYLLHPPLLDELGLDSALRWYVEGFSRRSGIRVQMAEEDEAGRLPSDVAAALFRVVQESLINIHRHSGSATAQVKLIRGPKQVVLQVRDRGRGIATGDHGTLDEAANLGVGIAGMRQRLRQLGGRLELRSSPRGTTVRAIVPLAAGDGA